VENDSSLFQLAALRAAQKKLGGTAKDELLSAEPSEFHKIVSQAAEESPMIKANVTSYTPEDYANFKTFLSEDKKSGYAIKPAKETTDKLRDELISVFSKEKGRGKDILKHAVDVGGAKQLDAFDINNKLPSLYGKEFKETSRLKFDPQYAPEGWDYQKLGTPDVVGMELDNATSKEIKRAIRKKVTPAAIKYGIPGLALAAASSDNSVDEALANTFIPGGAEALGDPLEDRMIMEEVKARQNYDHSQAGMAAEARRQALQKLGK
jgi:hypothetical protein